MYKINVCAEWSRVDKRTIKIAAIAVVCIDVGIRYPQIRQKTGVHLVPLSTVNVPQRRVLLCCC